MSLISSTTKSMRCCRLTESYKTAIMLFYIIFKIHGKNTEHLSLIYYILSCVNYDKIDEVFLKILKNK